MDKLITNQAEKIADLPIFEKLKNRLDESKLTELAADNKKMAVKRLTELERKNLITIFTESDTGISAGASVTEKSASFGSVINFGACLTNNQLQTIIKLRSGQTNLRSRSWISKNHGTKVCRACGISTETFGHISGFCPSLKKYRHDRHDTVVRILGEAIKYTAGNSSAIVNINPTIAANVQHNKPDKSSVA